MPATPGDYILNSPGPHPPLLPTLQTVLADSPTPLSRREILGRWPGASPRQDTLWRTLARGMELGLFEKSGTGTKADVFRFRVTTRPTELVAGEREDGGP
jgi:hypothetical protein